MTKNVSTDALAALRAATSALHERLDQHLRLSQPEATLNDYADHLRHIQAWLSSYPSHDAGRQLLLQTRLVSDLSHPSLAGQPALCEPSPRAPAPPRSANASDPAQAAYRWGVAYVIEGSQLGGSMLHERLAERFAPHPLAYLKGDEAGPGPSWRSYMHALQEHVHTPRQIEAAQQGAIDAFTALLVSFGLLPGGAETA